jgi:hypothetical protein
VRADVDAEVRRRHGQSGVAPRRAGARPGPDYAKVLKPLSFAIEFVDQNAHGQWARKVPASAKGPYEVVWLLRHTVRRRIASRTILLPLRCPLLWCVMTDSQPKPMLKLTTQNLLVRSTSTLHPASARSARRGW